MHLKDVRPRLEEEKKRYQWVKVGDGMIDYVGQMRALVRDGYDGTISLDFSVELTRCGQNFLARRSRTIQGIFPKIASRPFLFPIR